MRYDFPVGLTIEEVREAITLHNERLGMTSFIEADRGDHVIFNYLVSFTGSFPFPDTGDVALDRQYAILRECRGLTFHKETGRLLNRKFAKFFNVGEKPETQINVIDWTQPHRILEKLDGSMITPMFLGNWADISVENLRWCTKMGLTDVAKPVEEWVTCNQHYARWAAHVMYAGFTPIFEWCSRKQKIVIDYPEDRLVLTAVRNNHTGEYLSYENMLKVETHGIECVRMLPGTVENIEAFMEETRDLKGAEGYIIRFEDGRMYKVKAQEYCMLHKTKEVLQFEKDVVALIAHNMIDDAKAFMDAADRERVENFEHDFGAAVERTADEIKLIVATIRAEIGDGDRKAFAQKVTSQTFPDEYQRMLFSVNNGADALEEVQKVISKFAHPTAGTQTRINECRHLFGGLRWEDYRDKSYVADEG